MATSIVNRMVNEVLAGERSVKDFERQLARIFLLAEDEVEQFILSFYTVHSDPKTGKIQYVQLRRYLDNAELKQFRDVLRAWQTEEKEAVWPGFAAAIGLLLSRQRVTYLDAITIRIRHTLETAYLSERRQVADLARLNAAAMYYGRAFDLAKLEPNGINFESINSARAQQIADERWNDSTRYANYEDRIQDNLDKLLDEVDKFFPQTIAAGGNADAMIKVLKKRLAVAQGREIALIRTEITRIMAAAGIELYKVMEVEQYRFVAILDMVTSEICRSLNNLVFNVADARELVNLPPMHTNCRSTTEPIIASAEEAILNLLRSDKLEDFLNKYADDLSEELIDFFSKYRK